MPIEADKYYAAGAQAMRQCADAIAADPKWELMPKTAQMPVCRRADARVACDPPSGAAFRLPAVIGRCPDCGGPLDCQIDGGDDQGHTVMLTCINDCFGPGRQCDWQPIKDAARRYVNSANNQAD
jgi:hypothetical protein